MKNLKKMMITNVLKELNKKIKTILKSQIKRIVKNNNHVFFDYDKEIPLSLFMIDKKTNHSMNTIKVYIHTKGKSKIDLKKSEISIISTKEKLEIVCNLLEYINKDLSSFDMFRFFAEQALSKDECDFYFDLTKSILSKQFIFYIYTDNARKEYCNSNI